MNNYHIPVLMQEVLSGLNIKSGGIYIDATVGGGGHCAEILKRGGKLLGIDQDREAIEEAGKKLSELKGEWKLVKGNFKDIKSIAIENGLTNADGILFDLGVSSHQLDTASRGFSYRFPDETLDLRLDQSTGEPAYQLINRLSENEIYEILALFGEEQLARPIARAIIIARRVKKVRTTGDLVSIINNLIKNPASRNPILSRIFQALRITVNDELDALRQGLNGAKAVLSCGGRIAVISFQSLEDRIVKQFFRVSGWKLINQKAITATDTEIYINRRSRSAKLRIAEKIC